MNAANAAQASPPPKRLRAAVVGGRAPRAGGGGRHAAVALTYRGYPMVRRARSLVADGALGDLRLVHGAYIQDWLSDADRKSTRLNSSHQIISYAVFCLKKKKQK